MSKPILVSTSVPGIILRPDNNKDNDFSFTPYNCVGTVRQKGGSNWFHFPIQTTYVKGDTKPNNVDLTLKYGVNNATIINIDLRGSVEENKRIGNIKLWSSLNILGGNVWTGTAPVSNFNEILDLVVNVSFGDEGGKVEFLELRVDFTE